ASRPGLLPRCVAHPAPPAEELAAGYAERWQAELAYYHLKATLRGSHTQLRGQTPKLARQELWGLLAVYNALVDLAIATAVDLGIDPDHISFTTVLTLPPAPLPTQPPSPPSA